MKVMRTAMLALGAASVLLASPANAAGPLTVQGESASSYSYGCGDGGDAWDAGPVTYGGRTAAFFPASGCSASYSSTAVEIDSVTFLASGAAGTLCGTITISGVNSTSESVCVTNDTWVTVAVDPAVVTSAGRFTATWTTASGTPSYVNLFIDAFGGVGI